jgi:hypothetical protein
MLSCTCLVALARVREKMMRAGNGMRRAIQALQGTSLSMCIHRRRRVTRIRSYAHRCASTF